ncbi:MAG: hypothetical protein V4463_05370 [Pseudomonadota bacterium]
MSKSSYTPQPGSKISAAIQALLDGPMTAIALGNVMTAPANSVPQMLVKPIKEGMIIKLQDKTGLLHFSLPGMAVDESFTAWTSVERAPKAPKPPPRAAEAAAPFKVDAADPFGLVAARAGVAKRSPEGAAASVFSAPTADQVKHFANRAPVPKTPPPTSDPFTTSPFVAALFSTGDLLIQVGEASVRLSREHQEQLQQYVSRFKE